eukprot:scpid86157/ scgid34096/ 
MSGNSGITLGGVRVEFFCVDTSYLRRRGRISFLDGPENNSFQGVRCRNLKTISSLASSTPTKVAYSSKSPTFSLGIESIETTVNGYSFQHNADADVFSSNCLWKLLCGWRCLLTCSKSF